MQEGTPFAVVLSQLKHTGSEADDTAASFVGIGELRAQARRVRRTSLVGRKSTFSL
jgi:hypothetical protein